MEKGFESAEKKHLYFCSLGLAAWIMNVGATLHGLIVAEILQSKDLAKNTKTHIGFLCIAAKVYIGDEQRCKNSG